MKLDEFLRQTQADVRSQVDARRGEPGAYPYAESVFSEVIMDHMSEIGMTFDPVVCHYTARIQNAVLRLSGYAVSEESDQLDLFVSLYTGTDEVTNIPDSETKKAAEQCFRFLRKSAEGRLASTMDESNEAYGLVLTIQGTYNRLDQIRLYVLTDRRAQAKSFKPREIRGKTVKLEVMDIERLYRHWSEGKPRDELTIDFAEVCGGALPCIYVPGEMSDYDYAMTALPGEALRFAYDKYGDRLLEANVRSFLSVTGKVNKGIRDTLKYTPEHFMAYNNGIVIVADELRLGATDRGGPGICWLKGMQIVNGGQTTASLYFSKKKDPEQVDLRHVRVPAKIIVLRSSGSADEEEELVANISRYANSQNMVRQSDLSANKLFHRDVEKLALTTYCPDGVGRWFYERAAGSYKTMLAREGTTPSRLRKLRQSIPPARKFTKTDLAKYLNAWEQKPHDVAFGAQKNFARFMERLAAESGSAGTASLDVPSFKRMVAKAVIYRTVEKVTRGMFPAFRANIVAYTVAIVANRMGPRLDLDKVWQNQGMSPAFDRQVVAWARRVNDLLNQTARGRMVSEWAKKTECWKAVRTGTYTETEADIPELATSRTVRSSSQTGEGYGPSPSG